MGIRVWVRDYVEYDQSCKFNYTIYGSTCHISSHTTASMRSRLEAEHFLYLSIAFHIPIWNQHSCPCLDASDKHCLDQVHDLLARSLVHRACRLFSTHGSRRTLLSSPRDPIASRAFRICACVVKSTTETVSIEMATGGTSRWTVTVSSMRNLDLTAALFSVDRACDFGIYNTWCNSNLHCTCHTLAFCVFHSTKVAYRTSKYTCALHN